MTSIQNVSLEFSCPEKLSGNLFCNKCSRTVIDFTNKTCAELSEINKSLKPVCGIFRKSQLSEQFLKYAAVTFIATSTAISAGGQDRKPDSLLKASEQIEQEVEDEIFLGVIVDTPAEPIGGYPKFFDAISSRIKFPADLKEKGKLFVEFTIDPDGKIKNVRVVKSFNKLSDQEAVRVLSELNFPFIPGRQRGKAVETRLVIPIVFDPHSYERK